MESILMMLAGISILIQTGIRISLFTRYEKSAVSLSIDHRKQEFSLTLEEFFSDHSQKIFEKYGQEFLKLPPRIDYGEYENYEYSEKWLQECIEIP